MYLFIDTSYSIQIGILDESFHYKSSVCLEEKKASRSIHYHIHSMFKDLGLDWNGLAGVIHSTGPGFYTGLRVSLGLADILKLVGLKTYSFHHYQIPEILGKTKGAWITRAYKGEVFIYFEGKQQLCKVDMFLGYVKELRVNEIYIHSPVACEGLDLTSFALPIIETNQLLKTENQKIFPFIVSSQLAEPLLYFRPEEQEFKVS